MLQARAYAKINLALSVGPPEPAGTARAGFHPIVSWFHAVDLYDEIEGKAAPGDSEFRVRWEDGRAVDWPIERDLGWRALKALETRVGRALPMRVDVLKRIPAGGGLGGGSSDAAAVLRVANEVHGLGMAGMDLREVAFSIGSDLPYFIDEGVALHQPPRPALVRGFGERLRRLDPLEGKLMTLILPPYGCDTAAVYRAFDDLVTARLRDDAVRSLADSGTLTDATPLFNDLAFAAEVAEPRLRDLRRAIGEKLGGAVHVSGSGSTMFVVGTHASISDVAVVSRASAFETRLVGATDFGAPGGGTS